MKTTTTLLSLLLLAACGELVHPDTYGGNRTIGPEGGAIDLERLRVTVPADILSRDLTFRLEELDGDALPGGALGPAYRLLPAEIPGSLMAAGLRVTYRFEMDELPTDTFFVGLSVAALHDDEWMPLDATEWDPIGGEISGYSAGTGVFTLVHLALDLP